MAFSDVHKIPNSDKKFKRKTLLTVLLLGNLPGFIYLLVHWDVAKGIQSGAKLQACLRKNLICSQVVLVKPFL